MLSVLEKLSNVYQHIPNWIFALIGFISTWLGDSKELMLYVFIIVIIDTIVGITRSVKQGVGIKSSGIRSVIGKLLVYFTMMLMTIVLDKTGCFESLIITRVATGIILGAEAISILGSLAIIYPKMAAISLIKRVLCNEIADKLKTDKDEVEKLINKNNNDDKDETK